MNSEKKVERKKRSLGKYFVHDFVKVTGSPAMLWILLRKIYVSEIAKKKIRGGAIVICNHTGFIDPAKMMCAFWYRRVNFLAIKDMFKTRLQQFFFKHMQCLPVDKDNFSVSVFKEVVERAKQGALVCLYPEGQIHREDTGDGIGAFKAGAVLMAFKSEVPIVPIYSPKERSGIWHDMIIGEPINMKEVCGPEFNMENIEKANQYLREKELELIRIYNERKNKK